MGIRKFFFLLVGTISLFYACEDPSEVGVGFVEEIPFTVTYYDTVSIKISTVRFDSIVTSSSSGLLVGHAVDEKLGELTTKAFFQVGRESLSTYPDEDYAVFDSLSLELIFNGYLYYDSTKVQKYYLYSVLNEMELGDDGYLYNTTDLKYKSDSAYYLGEISFTPNVKKGDPEYLRINDTYGKAIFDLLMQKDDIVTDDGNFSEYIRGFALVPDSLNTCIIGLDNSTNFKFFYSEKGEQTELSFPISDNVHFTQISSSGGDSLLNTLNSQKDILSSEALGNKAIIQGGTGLGIRLEIPYLNYISELSENNLVTDAELIFTPLKNSYSSINDFSSDLAAYKVDKYNRIISELTISPVLYYDVEFREETHYVINIHSYLEERLSLLEQDDSALLITLSQSDISGTVDRILIGDEKNDNKSYLKMIIMNINDSF